MIKGLYNASKSMNDKINNIQIVANNLANINTDGYKREIPFSEYMTRESNGTVNHLTDFSEGEFIETDNPLDLAISGNAFFSVKTENGTAITKNGKFQIDDDGFLATADGARVLGDRGEINLDEAMTSADGTISISKEGEIKVGELFIDFLRVVNVEDPEKLQRGENQTFTYPEEVYNNANAGEFNIHQGFVETSNTNAILEMQSMIQLQNDYEASQKMIASLDSLMGKYGSIGKV